MRKLSKLLGLVLGCGFVLGTINFSCKISSLLKVVAGGYTEVTAATLNLTTKTYGCSAYSGSIEYGDWTIVNGANNNKGWEYFKMGGKSATLSSANPCYIYSTAGSSVEYNKIEVHIPTGSLSKSGMSVKSWGVYVYSDSALTTQIDYVGGGTITSSEGTFSFTPSTGKRWSEKSYYKVSWDLANTTTTNGIVCVDKITCYKDTYYSLTYDANGATSGNVPSDTTQFDGNTDATVLGNTGNLSKEFYNFNGWNTKKDGKGTSYVEGNKFRVTENTTLYAQWSVDSVSKLSTPVVSYNSTNLKLSWDAVASASKYEVCITDYESFLEDYLTEEPYYYVGDLPNGEYCATVKALVSSSDPTHTNSEESDEVEFTINLSSLERFTLSKMKAQIAYNASHVFNERLISNYCATVAESSVSNYQEYNGSGYYRNSSESPDSTALENACPEIMGTEKCFVGVSSDSKNNIISNMANSECDKILICGSGSSTASITFNNSNNYDIVITISSYKKNTFCVLSLSNATFDGGSTQKVINSADESVFNYVDVVIHPTSKNENVVLASMKSDSNSLNKISTDNFDKRFCIKKYAIKSSVSYQNMKLNFGVVVDSDLLDDFKTQITEYGVYACKKADLDCTTLPEAFANGKTYIKKQSSTNTENIASCDANGLGDSGDYKIWTANIIVPSGKESEVFVAAAYVKIGETYHWLSQREESMASMASKYCAMTDFYNGLTAEQQAALTLLASK